ncbi:MAG: hypothetical protein R3B47_13145 [Bacteroidia bacterium]
MATIINRKRADDICARLMQKGFASTNTIVFGIGSLPCQYNGDSFGFR